MDWPRDLVLYILPFGSVRLRIFRLAHRLVRFKHEHSCSQARGADVSFRDVTIETPDRKMWLRDVNDVIHRKRARRILEIWKKSQLSWVLASEEDGWLSELAEALRRALHVTWGRWKSQHRKIVYLSLCWKTFQLKGNKEFRTWTKKS